MAIGQVIDMARSKLKRDSIKQPPVSVESMVEALKPIISLGTVAIGIVIWAFTTFAEKNYVKEQNAMIMNTIEQRHREALEHSDMNRDRMMSVLVGIQDTVKTIESRTWAQETQKKK